MWFVQRDFGVEDLAGNVPSIVPLNIELRLKVVYRYGPASGKASRNC